MPFKAGYVKKTFVKKDYPKLPPKKPVEEEKKLEIPEA
jgi:hypothetical protein